MGEDLAGAGLPRRHRLPRAGRAARAARARCGFNLVGYGCTTCIGNSGPLPDAVAEAIAEHDLAVVAVLSGNRNFEGRIHPQVRASYLASPPLVVAYALAGIDRRRPRQRAARHRHPTASPSSCATSGRRPRRCVEAIESAITPDALRARVRRRLRRRRALAVDATRPTGDLFDWDPDSTYVREPSFFTDWAPSRSPLRDVVGARVLAMLGDSVTTDHISPAGSIQPDEPRRPRTCRSTACERRDFNSYGSRRGNHEVMVRGTFANIRLRNGLVPGVEGGVTEHLPTGERLSDLRRRRCATRGRHAAGACSPARSTAPARRATGRPRARCCSACAP